MEPKYVIAARGNPSHPWPGVDLFVGPSDHPLVTTLELAHKFESKKEAVTFLKSIGASQAWPVSCGYDSPKVFPVEHKPAMWVFSDETPGAQATEALMEQAGLLPAKS